MKIKTFFSLFLITFFFQYAYSQCPEGINLLPMYGEKIKCPEQVESDKKFLAEIDKIFKSRHEASKAFSSKAWEFFNRNDLQTAMKRFNQSWLLDNNNYESYWGFANIRGKQNQLEEAKKLFDLAKKLNPTNSNFFISSASTLGGLYNKTNNKSVLQNMIIDLEKAIKIDPENALAYAELAAAYMTLNDKIKAKENLKKAEKLNPSVVNPNLKKVLSQ